MRPLTRLLRIQYATNLEVGQKKIQGLLRPVAPILTLTGNVGSPVLPEYHNFIRFCSQNWLHVLVVPGLRDCYNPFNEEPLTAEELIERGAAVCRGFANVHFLNRTHMYCEGVRFISAPLWSPTSTEDFKNIYVSEKDGGLRLIGPDDFSAKKEEDYKWIQSIMNQRLDGIPPTVLLSHRAPKESVGGLRALISNEVQHIESGTITRLPARESFIEISIPVESVEDYRDPLLVASTID